MIQVHLSSGITLRCRNVPPYLRDKAFASVPEPEFPMLSLKSAAGGTEKAPALADSPEYEKYQADLAKYRRELRSIAMDFDLAYGVMSWRLPGEEQFTEEVPEKWKLPGLMAHFGIDVDTEDGYERRLQYIQWLIGTDDDANKVRMAIGLTLPLEPEEVEAALAPFDSKSGLPQ